MRWRLGALLGAGTLAVATACAGGSTDSSPDVPQQPQPPEPPSSAANGTDEDAAPAAESPGESPPASSGYDASVSNANSACGAFVTTNTSSLVSCGDGKSHCYDASRVLHADRFGRCGSGEVCVPDKILTAAGAPLKTCTSVAGPGACIPLEVPGVSSHKDKLTQDACDADELCVPCADPTNNNTPTGACGPEGVYAKACSSGTPASPDAGHRDPGDAGSAPTCCAHPDGTAAGVCLEISSIPAALKSQAQQDSCVTGNACVPTPFVRGAPQRCKILGLFDGVCLDQCFAGKYPDLSIGGCDDTSLCAGCDLVPQGTPGCS